MRHSTRRYGYAPNSAGEVLRITIALVKEDTGRAVDHDRCLSAILMTILPKTSSGVPDFQTYETKLDKENCHADKKIHEKCF